MARKIKFDFTKSLTSTGLKIGGGLAAKMVTNKIMPDMNPKIKAGALLALSIAAPAFVKNQMVTDLADGMAVVAGGNLVGSFVPALAGFEDDDIVNGIGYSEDDYEYIPDNNETVNGDDNDTVM